MKDPLDKSYSEIGIFKYHLKHNDEINLHAT